MPRLDFYAEHELFVKVKLGDEDVVLGRCEDCTVQLPHHRVSRYHAIIRPGEGGFWIQDSSRNGTRVNDKFIDEPTKLEAGDRIYIDRYVIVYRTDDVSDDSWSADTSSGFGA